MLAQTRTQSQFRLQNDFILACNKAKAVNDHVCVYVHVHALVDVDGFYSHEIEQIYPVPPQVYLPAREWKRQFRIYSEGRGIQTV
jgi:hypothetical protein